MAEFAPAFDRMIANEGGFKLTDIPGDRGGQTYAGIARRMNPDWAGWPCIDRGETPATDLVRDFYLAGWWVPLRCDEITDQRVAESLFDFAVNTSGYGKPVVAAKLAQLTVGAVPDGVIGARSLAAINAIDPDLFLARFALAKLARYRDICAKDKTQMKFLLGWINRLLKGAA